jgi:hypothetical protein
MKLHMAIAWLAAFVISSSLFAADNNVARVIVVLGAPGETEYGDEFRDAAQKIQSSLKNVEFELVDGTQSQAGDKPDREVLLESLAKHRDDKRPLWLILIGHGTFDGKVAKFNLRGPDLTPADLSKALDGISSPQVIIDASSCSSPFVSGLSGNDRVVITGTKSGSEVNYSRFGRFLAEAIADPDSDLDHDRSISALEAFLSASNRVKLFYQEESRLATEQALLDDNGDKKGTPASFFRGMRVQAKAKDGETVDGALARRLVLVQSDEVVALTPEQVSQRDRIETDIESLRLEKSNLADDVYYEQLEKLLLELAAVLGLNKG